MAGTDDAIGLSREIRSRYLSRSALDATIR
jgi:hypothetical protein